MDRRKRVQEEADAHAEVWLLSWLSRRDYSVVEAGRRLKRKGVSEARIGEIMEKFIAEGTICDRRFAEGLVRNRAEKGKGPLLVDAELRSRGVDSRLAMEISERYSWREIGEAAKRKRFGEGVPSNSEEFDTQARFLAGRGFPMDIIFSLLGR